MLTRESNFHLALFRAGSSGLFRGADLSVKAGRGGKATTLKTKGM